MSLWFTADLHFCHKGILGFCQTTRPFKDVDEMNSAIVERWNKKVRPQDEVYFLGDFAFCKDPETHFYQLNGKIHLIQGNHDYGRKSLLDLPWASVSDLKTVKYNGMRAVLCHFPLSSWWNAHHGYLHFHGHSHNGLRPQMNHRFDVGFDAFPDGPVSFEELAAIAATQKFEPVDHHTKAD